MMGALRQAYHVQWHIEHNETTDNYTSLAITNITSDDYRPYECSVSVVNPIDKQQWVRSFYVHLYNSSTFFSWNQSLIQSIKDFNEYRKSDKSEIPYYNTTTTLFITFFSLSVCVSNNVV